MRTRAIAKLDQVARSSKPANISLRTEAIRRGAAYDYQRSATFRCE
jgi:hypothetical protein